MEVGKYVQIDGDIYENAYYKIISIDADKKEATVRAMFSGRLTRELLTCLSPSDISKEDRRLLKQEYYERHRE